MKNLMKKKLNTSEPILKDSKKLGSFGEELVSNFLQNQGFCIKKRNYRKRFGEIDLIVQKGDLLAFVEVKTRKKSYFELEEVIVASKQRKIILTAKEYIASHNIYQKICRFDVALVEKNISGEFEVKYIADAFNE